MSAAPARGRRLGGQNRPKSGMRRAERDLRGRLPRVLLRVPADANQDNALDALKYGIYSMKVNYIFDADLRCHDFVNQQ